MKKLSVVLVAVCLGITFFTPIFGVKMASATSQFSWNLAAPGRFTISDETKLKFHDGSAKILPTGLQADGYFLWKDTHWGNETSASWGSVLAVDANGNIYLGGQTAEDSTWANTYAFVVKLDSNYNEIWYHRYYNAYDPWTWQTAPNVYGFGNQSQSGIEQVAVDPNTGAVVAAGLCMMEGQAPPPNSCFKVFRINPDNGNVIWEYNKEKIGMHWADTYDGSDGPVFDSQGNFYFADSDTSPSINDGTGPIDLYKFDLDGNILWHIQDDVMVGRVAYNDRPAYNDIWQIGVDHEDNVFINADYFPAAGNQPIRVALAKFNGTDGSALWGGDHKMTDINNSAFSANRGMAIDQDNNVYSNGNANTQPEQGCFVRKLDKDGNSKISNGNMHLIPVSGFQFCYQSAVDQFNYPIFGSSAWALGNEYHHVIARYTTPIENLTNDGGYAYGQAQTSLFKFTESTISATSGPSKIAVNQKGDIYMMSVFADDNRFAGSPWSIPISKTINTYPDTIPGSGTPLTLSNKDATPYTKLSAFSVDYGAMNQKQAKFQISNDNANWYYWNGSAWTLTAGDNNSTVSDINAHIGTFASQIGTGSFYFKAYLETDGTGEVDLKNVNITYDPLTDNSTVTPLSQTVSTKAQFDAGTFSNAASFHLLDDGVKLSPATNQTITWGNTAAGSDVNVTFNGNSDLSGGTRNIPENPGVDDSLAIKYNEWTPDAHTVTDLHMNESDWSAADSITDASGNGNNYTAAGDSGKEPTPVSGWMGNSALFHSVYNEGGTSSYIFRDFPLQARTANMTYMMWVRRGAGTTGYTDLQQNGIIGQGGLIEGGFNGANKTFKFVDEASTVTIDKTFPQDTDWHFFAIRRNMTQNDLPQNKMTIFIDHDTPMSGDATDAANWANAMVFGAWGNHNIFMASAGDVGGGGMDEFVMTNNAMSDADIQAMAYRYRSSQSAIVSYNMGAAKTLNNLSWNASETGDNEGKISKVEAYGADNAWHTLAESGDVTSPISNLNLAVPANLQLRFTLEPKSDTLHSTSPKLLDVTATASAYPASGTYASPSSGGNTIDLGANFAGWSTNGGKSLISNVAVPTGTSIQYEGRTSANGTTWSSWANLGTATAGATSFSVTQVSMNSLLTGSIRYLQIRTTLASTGSSTPTLYDYTIYYSHANAPAPTATPAQTSTGTSSESSASSEGGAGPTSSTATTGTNQLGFPFTISYSPPKDTNGALVGTLTSLTEGQTVEIANQLPLFQGTTLPGAEITVYISSGDKVIITDKFFADANGNWSYQVKTPLGFGDYTIRFLIKDKNGKQVGETLAYKFKIVEKTSLANNLSEQKTGLGLIKSKISSLTWIILASSAIAAAILLYIFAMIKLSRTKSKTKYST